MADPIWEKKFRGEPVWIAPEDLTVQRMRAVKESLGDAYGIPQQFLAWLFAGEMDALSAAIQISWARDGKKPLADLAQFDFNMAEIAEPDKPKRPMKKKPEPDPTPGDTSDETRSSETP